MKIIKIAKENRGVRLDKFLTEKLPQFSRSQIQKMIKAGEVLVNEKTATVHRFLKENDIIQIPPPYEDGGKGEVKKQNPKPRPNRSWAATNATMVSFIDTRFARFCPSLCDPLRKGRGNIKIIEDNNDFLIINKPAGLLVHPTERDEIDTLADWLVARYPELKKIGEDPSRPAIVHRLDKDVSGLMLIPKNQDAFDFFKRQFKIRTLTKKYIALVNGEVEKDHGVIDLPIGRSKTRDGLYAAHPEARGERFHVKDKTAITEFTVLEKFKNYTLLEIQIHTGRTHQIRVHLTAYGHPIVGDTLYLNKKTKIKKPLERIFLHADYLSFTGPDEKSYEFEEDLPDELCDFLKSLKKI